MVIIQDLQGKYFQLFINLLNWPVSRYYLQLGCIGTVTFDLFYQQKVSWFKLLNVAENVFFSAAPRLHIL